MTTAKIYGGALSAGQNQIAELGTTKNANTNYSLSLSDLQNEVYENADIENARVQNPIPSTVNLYSPTQPYFVSDYARDGLTNTVYQAVRGDTVDQNIGKPLSDQAYWKSVGNKFLPIQESFNSVYYVLSSLIAEMQKAGLADWISTTSYDLNAIVKAPGTINIYYSKISNNLGNILTDTNSWGFVNDLNNLANLNSKYAPIVSAALQGTPTAPTPLIGDNSTRLATTAYVKQALQLNPTDLGAIKIYKYFSNENVPNIKTFSNGAKGYLFNGQTLTQAEAPVLFAERGWGASIVLENRDGRVSICVGSSYEIGSFGGSPTHALTINEMPSHTHTLTSDSSRTGKDPTSIGNTFNTSNGDFAIIAGATKATSFVGGNQPHNIMQPYVVDAHYLIAW